MLTTMDMWTMLVLIDSDHCEVSETWLSFHSCPLLLSHSLSQTSLQTEPSISVFLLTRYEWREDLGCENSTLYALLIFFFTESSNTRQLDTECCLCVRSFPFVSSTYMGRLSTLQPGRNCVWFHFKLHNWSELASLVSPLHNRLLSLWRLH